MDIEIKKEFHPLLETMGLIYLARNQRSWKKDTIEELENFGIDGENFFQRNLTCVEQYLQSFLLKYRKLPEEDFFFQDNMQFLLFVVMVLSGCPELPAHVEDFSDTEILKKIEAVLSKEFKPSVTDLSSLESRFQFIQQLDADMDYKWKLLVFLNNPQKYLMQIHSIYEENLPAYEYAYSKNRDILESLLARCPRYVEPSFAKMVASLGGEVTFYVSLAFPLMEMYIGTLGVYGIFIEQMQNYGERKKREKDELMMIMKAFGDKSKFEILYSLKESPKYNLEIAEQLHLTAATMSHHMNILLSQGLVTVEKKEGKVYYQIERKQIERVGELLKEVFLC